MGKGDKGMGTKMRRLIFFVCLIFSANFSFAQGKPSELLPLPKALQGDIPWFAMVAKDGGGTYNDILNKDKLKAFAAQKNSKRVVLAFYATWCIPCREGLAKMSNRATELEKNGVLVVLINVGEDNYIETSKWVSGYMKAGWLLGFDKFRNLPEKFGLSKEGEEMPLPRTLLLDQNLRPLLLIGNEGDDFQQILFPNPN